MVVSLFKLLDCVHVCVALAHCYTCSYMYMYATIDIERYETFVQQVFIGKIVYHVRILVCSMCKKD